MPRPARAGAFQPIRRKMATIKGQNLRVLLGTSASNLKCISVAKSCVLHVSAQVGESSSKDSTSEWQEQEITAINWDVQADALVISDDDDEYRPGAKAIDQLQVGRVYVIRFSRTAGAAGQQNRDAVADAMQLTGPAILSDLNINAQNAEVASGQAKFTGSGDLTPYTPPTE